MRNGDYAGDVRVDEADRLANANSFGDTAEVLRDAGVAWMAVGCARGAYENALATRFLASSSAGRSRVSTRPGPVGADARQHHVVAGVVCPPFPTPGRGLRRGGFSLKAWCTVRIRKTVDMPERRQQRNLLEHNVGRFVATPGPSTPTKARGR